jgi:hypothetical protein
MSWRVGIYSIRLKFNPMTSSLRLQYVW